MADWNEFKNGIQCVVTGFNKRDTTGRPFKILKRTSIHATERGIQIKGVEMIKELHEAFRADHVYVDQGFGGMQSEILSKYFIVEKNLPYVFKSIDFSSTYSFEDPISQNVIKRRMKVMMVHFLQKRFEMGEIQISSTEEKEKNLLLTQLAEYKIVSYDNRDQPKFGGLDHILDGLMLSVFAIIENYSTIFDRNTGTYIGTVVKKESPTENINNFFSKKPQGNQIIDYREPLNIKEPVVVPGYVENFNFIEKKEEVGPCENIFSVRNKAKRSRRDYDLF